ACNVLTLNGGLDSILNQLQARSNQRGIGSAKHQFTINRFQFIYLLNGSFNSAIVSLNVRHDTLSQLNMFASTPEVDRQRPPFCVEPLDSDFHGVVSRTGKPIDGLTIVAN